MEDKEGIKELIKGHKVNVHNNLSAQSSVLRDLRLAKSRWERGAKVRKCNLRKTIKVFISEANLSQRYLERTERREAAGGRSRKKKAVKPIPTNCSCFHYLWLLATETLN